MTTKTFYFFPHTDRLVATCDRNHPEAKEMELYYRRRIMGSLYSKGAPEWKIFKSPVWLRPATLAEVDIERGTALHDRAAAASSGKLIQASGIEYIATN
jgi:hypothetical protein